MATPEWHWEQGIKYAIEAIKAALLLNGAAAIALMTFANYHKFTGSLLTAVIIFVVGAFCSVIAFYAAYLTQLQYGNAELPSGASHVTLWMKARRYNQITLAVLAVSLILFAVGVVYATVVFQANI
jgi:hypothetical protein